MIMNACHNAFNTAALPIMMNTLENLKQAIINDKDFFAIFPPIVILTVFVVYPVGVFRFLSRNIEKCKNPNDFPEFNKKHKAAFSGLRL